jgi:hypothetical protein
MTTLVPLALLSWILISVVFFARLPRQHAVIAVFVLGTLFLPVIHVEPSIDGMPAPLSLPAVKLTKFNAISYAALIASLLFDGRRWLSYRPRAFDLPVVALCVCPMFSSLANDLGLYDGAAGSLYQTMTWGVPYLMGRIYLGDPAGLRALTLGIVRGALLYVPFCLFEMRFSPQLHSLLYGFAQHSFLQTIRFGGYRPMVFMQHGLELGMWMAVATMLASWLYWTGAASGFPQGSRAARPMLGAMLLLLPITVLCRSTGALLLGTAGFATLVLSRAMKTPVPLLVLLSVSPLYIAVRASSAWDGAELVNWSEALIDPERAESLEFRLQNEDILVAKALERPLFGWGGWGRSRVYNEEGEDITVTDGLWIITLGTQGFFGLTALWLTILLPSARFCCLYSARRWSEPELAPAAGLAVLLAVVMTDYLPNGLVNSVYTLAAGGLSGMTFRSPPEEGATRHAASEPDTHGCDQGSAA